MKHFKSFLLFIFCISSLATFAQNTFTFNYGLPNVEEAPFIITESPSGNIFAAVYKQTNNVVTSHILKLNSTGNLLLEKSIRQRRLLGMKQTSNGLFCFGYNEIQDSISIFVAMLDENLNYITDRSYGIIDYSVHNRVVYNSMITEGDTIKCIYNCFNGESFTFKTNLNCDSLSSKSFIAGIYDICKKTDSTGYIITGATSVTGLEYLGTQAIFTDKDMNISIVKTMDVTPGGYFTRTYIEPLHENYVIAGTGHYYNQKNAILIAIFDQAMNKVSTNVVGSTAFDNYMAFYNGLLVDGNYDIFTYATINDAGGMPYKPYDNNLLLVKTDSLQNVIWEKYYGGDAFYQAYTFTKSADGGIIVGATKFDHTVAPWDNVYIFKVKADGTITSTNDLPNLKVSELLLYPNPGKKELHLKTAFQKLGGTFVLTDVSGKKVLEKNISQNETTLNTQNLKQSIYFYTYFYKNKPLETGKWVKQ